MADAKAIGYLELNLDGYKQAIETAKKALAGLAAAFAAFKAIDFFKDGIRDAINFGNEMYNASRKAADFDPGNLLLVQKALEQSGRSAEEAQAEISSFIDTGRNLKDIFKGQDNYAAALKQVSAEYGSQAKVLSENAKRFSMVFDLLQSVGEKIKTFFLAMTAQFLKPMQVLLEQLDKVDLAGVGEKFGKHIADAINMLSGAIANGTLWEIAKKGLIIAAKEFQNYMEGAVNFLTDGLWAVLSVVLDGAFKLVDRFLSEIDWNPVLTAIVGMLGKIGNFLSTMFLKLGAILTASIQTGVANSPWFKAFLLVSGPVGQAIVAEGGSKSFAENFKNAEANQAPAYDILKKGNAVASELISGSMEGVKKTAADSAKGITSIEGSDAMKAWRRRRLCFL